MKKKIVLKSHYFSGLPKISAVCLMAAAFIAGTYVEQALWAMPDRVDFRQSLPWFIIFTFGTLYFNNAFDLSRRIHYLAFSVFISILFINVFMMALPFFGVLYYVQVTTLFIIVLLECLSMGVWVLFSHNYWLRCHPPVSAVLVCDDPEHGKVLAQKINHHTLNTRIDSIIAYGDAALLPKIEPFKAVIIAQPSAEAKNEIVFQCWEMQKKLIVIPDIYELIINNATLIQFDDVMAYQMKRFGLSGSQRFFKRAFDLCFSALALILLSPLMLALAIIIKRDGGSAIFSQKRVTRGGKEFKLYKFRTMIPDAEKYTGPTLAFKDDPRITKCGKWLRQTRLDEIPQFWNVLIGDMSIVGPRPEREYFINIYKQTLPEYQYRTNIRAGITGLAHVLGKYNTPPEERIKLDLTYIQNYSFLLDVKIIIETVRVVLTKEYAEGVEANAQTEAREPEDEREPAMQGASSAPRTAHPAGKAKDETPEENSNAKSSDMRLEHITYQ
ncbi:MAG: sugar transferase [Oscillospiraceae bacterium]